MITLVLLGSFIYILKQFLKQMVIRTNDSDVLLLAVASITQLQGLKQVCLAFGTVRQFRYNILQLFKLQDIILWHWEEKCMGCFATVSRGELCTEVTLWL